MRARFGGGNMSHGRACRLAPSEPGVAHKRGLNNVRCGVNKKKMKAGMRRYQVRFDQDDTLGGAQVYPTRWERMVKFVVM